MNRLDYLLSRPTVDPLSSPLVVEMLVAALDLPANKSSSFGIYKA